MARLILLAFVFLLASCSEGIRISKGHQTGTPQVVAISWLSSHSSLDQALVDIDPEYNEDLQSTFTPTQRTDHELILEWFNALKDDDFEGALNMTLALPDVSHVHTQTRAIFFYSYSILLEATYGAGFPQEKVDYAKDMLNLIQASTGFNDLANMHPSEIGILEEVARLMLWKSYFIAHQNASSDFMDLYNRFMFLMNTSIITSFADRSNSHSALILATRQYVGVELIKASHNLAPTGDWNNSLMRINYILGNISNLNIHNHSLPFTSLLTTTRNAVNTANGDKVYEWLVNGGGDLIYNGSSLDIATAN